MFIDDMCRDGNDRQVPKYVWYDELSGITISRGSIKNTPKDALKHSFKKHDITVVHLGKQQQRPAWNATIWNLETLSEQGF